MSARGLGIHQAGTSRCFPLTILTQTAIPKHPDNEALEAWPSL